MMEVVEAGYAEYSNLFPRPYHIFNSSDFAQVNVSKIERVIYLLFKNPRLRLGLIVGVRDNSLYTPFSAPFGGFSFVNQDISISYIEASVLALSHYATENEYEKIHYTMPPLFYNELFNSKLLNVLHRNEYSNTTIDLNYQFDLQRLGDDYELNLWYNARKNLKISHKQDFEFMKCEDLQSKSQAYEVIRENRNRKGFPLKMTWEQIEETIKVIRADFFLLKKKDDNVAAAVVFHVAEQIVQVIYWGDIPDFAGLRPMNFLAHSIVNFYKRHGIKYIDVGPSTENGIPNYGLCEFKESIGCGVTPKFSFTKTLK